MTRIEDYAVLGDTQTVALVGRDGSVDWWCAPRIDSGACFAALLGTRDDGRWQIRPAAARWETTRRYVDDTLILETVFTTADGVVAIVDFMSPGDRRPTVYRVVEGRAGRVAMELELVVRFDYGSIVPWTRATGDGLTLVAGCDALRFLSPVRLEGRDLTTRAEFTISEGERREFSLTWYPAHEPPPIPFAAQAAFVSTRQWWRTWASKCTYDGEWRDDVMRSLLTLKALTYAPTGAIAAAATTSLPEKLGGVRNWDYRYSWLRDATFTLHTLLVCGYTDEATAWMRWLRRAVAGNPEDVQIMYGVGGERRLTEVELPWLDGYEGSAPVRVGNAASEQFQLDVYGEVMDAALAGFNEGLLSDPGFGDEIGLGLVAHLEQVWTEPDDGIWEVRGPRRHFTHSKVMAWVAFDRAVRIAERRGGDGARLARWRAARDAVHADVCAKAWNAERNSFVQYYGADVLDASLLMMATVGFLPPTDQRIVATVEAIQRELVVDGFVQRYQTDAADEVDGLPPGEGAFLMTTFWLADNLALLGRTDEALSIFERLRGLRNDVGLLAEEYDPQAKRMVGNFPQAFSHVGLVNTAANLSPSVPSPSRARAEGMRVSHGWD
jgi:GH15 family glucan-1,4-alpha-glucosidase